MEKILVVTPKLGLHARPAALFVQEAGRFRSTVMVSKDGVEINGKSVMGLMLLAAEHGSKITVKVDGPDEKLALDAIEKLFARKFDED